MPAFVAGRPERRYCYVNGNCGDMAHDGYARMPPATGPRSHGRTGKPSMTRTDLVHAVAGELDVSISRAGGAVDAVLHAIERGLQNGQEVRLAGFGTFAVSTRKATTGRNPRTGEVIAVPSTRSVKFRPGKPLRDAVSGMGVREQVGGG